MSSFADRFRLRLRAARRGPAVGEWPLGIHEVILGYGARIFAKLMVMAPFVNQLHPFRAVKDPGGRLVVLKDHIEAGSVTPVIDKTSR